MKSMFFVFAFAAFCVAAAAQDASKPWGDWSKKDVEKILNESAWGQTFSQEGPEAVETRAISNPSQGLQRSGESGEARPNASPELKTQLQGFIDRDFGDYLVVAFSIESADERMTKGAMMGLSRLTVEGLKDKVYLERKDGKRATLTDYRAPGEDGMGAKFIFSRTLDGKPFIAEDADTVKFFFQLSDKQKISMRYKVAGMVYGGKLEY
jgi:hypothetical protein